MRKSLPMPRLAEYRAGALAVILFVALSYYRAGMVDNAYGAYTGCRGCLDAVVLANDALLLAAFVALLAVSRLFAHRVVRWALALVGVVLLLAFGADLVVFKLLTHRLLLVDLLHFGGEGSAFRSVLAPLASSPAAWGLAVALVASVLVAGWAIATGPASRGAAAAFAILAGAIAVASFAMPRAEYIHYAAALNLWQVNVEVDPTKAYGEEFARKIRALPPPPASCEVGGAEQRSVILLVVESLSSYHSKLFSGLNDFTPQIDALAGRNAYFTRFHANGFSTETGLIALLTGHTPLPTSGRLGGVMPFTRVEGDLHRWLASQGYRTAFFTTGDLGFGERVRWLPAIGIQYAEGAKHPFYDGMPRGPFGAASDRALFDRFLQWHAAEGGKSRFMATILTVATHPPYVHGGTEEAAKFREVDAEVGRFAAELDQRGFFREGVLVIVGDHRGMTPLPPSERERMGASAEMRVPLVVVGDDRVPKGGSDALLQQADLVPSLRYMLGAEVCRTEWQGRFLGGPAAEPRYVVYADPFRRNQVTVLEGSQRYRLVLDGDRTHWIDPPKDAAQAERLLARVNAERIARMAEFGFVPPQPR
jgi:hypothetical protein